MKNLILIILFMISSIAEATTWKDVDKIIETGVKQKVFPGGILVVGSTSSHLHVSIAGDGELERIYDIASLTKVVATTTAIMMLEERGEIKLTDKVMKYFPHFHEGQKASVTLEDLLRHRAGLPAGNKPKPGEKFLDYLVRITDAPLNYKPGSKTVYSDLSFILLGRVVEIVSGTTLGDFVQQKIFHPLKMHKSSFQVAGLQCAPTSTARECEVHDPTANSLRPATVGNAGVFSTVTDLSIFARMILNRGELDGVRILKSSTLDKMLTPDGPRGLGWDFTSEYSTKPRGDVFPAGISFGHTGYTGTTMWIDPKSGSYYVFLSNRVYLGDERTKGPFGEFRHKLSTAIGSVIYK